MTVGNLEATMVLRILSRGAIAAVAGATMLAASSVPSSAFTLASPSLEQPVASATFSPSGGMAVGMAAGTADGAGIEAMAGAAAGIAGAGAAAGAPAMASLRSTIAGGAPGAAAAGSDARGRDSAA